MNVQHACKILFKNFSRWDNIVRKPHGVNFLSYCMSDWRGCWHSWRPVPCYCGSSERRSSTSSLTQRASISTSTSTPRSRFQPSPSATRVRTGNVIQVTVTAPKHRWSWVVRRFLFVTFHRFADILVRDSWTSKTKVKTTRSHLRNVQRKVIIATKQKLETSAPFYMKM